ncbi:MAG: hypothetical protein ACREVZ_01790 [Burkholderiales bacterium]
MYWIRAHHLPSFPARFSKTRVKNSSMGDSPNIAYHGAFVLQLPIPHGVPRMKINSSRIVAVAVGSALAGTSLFGLYATQAHASKKDKAAVPAVVTVFVPAGTGRGAADAANETHAKYIAAGYKFADLDAYVENADQKGLWITYVRKD